MLESPVCLWKRRSLWLTIGNITVIIPFAMEAVHPSPLKKLVPSLQPSAEQKSPTAALALLLCGYIGAHKFTLLSPKYASGSSRDCH